MHVRKRAWRLVTALALVTFALPLASSATSTSVSAQTTGGTAPPAIASAGFVNPSVAFNPLGTPHTVNFVCTAAATAATGTAAIAPGCYGVTVSTNGAASAPIVSAICGGVAATSSASSASCAASRSPICPVGTIAATGTGTTFATAMCVASATSTAAAPDITNIVSATINPNAPQAYTIDFTGYVPATAAGSCPAGTGVGGVAQTLTLPSTTGAGPVTGLFCQFTVEAQKKYVEVTSIVLTPVGTCGGNLTFSEGLKSYFGPACVVNIVASGTVVLKTVGDCTGEPATGTAAPAEYGPSAVYNCTNGTLSVTGVTGSTSTTADGTTYTTVQNASLPGVNLGPGGSLGVGSFTTVGTLGSLCAGSTNTTSGIVVTTTTSGATATLCPTGPGTASLQLCLVGPDGTPNSLPNTQPPLCSNTITFNFTLNAARAVPYVRWAGEKIELTKCFGIGLSGFPVEFTLQQSDTPGLGATLLPAALTNNSGDFVGVSQNTIFTTTDANGCATVIGLAAGEGVMYVDAAVFSGSSAGGLVGTPLINEHAFEVFYLKFDHVDLENIKFQTYTTAQALTPYLGFLSTTPALNGAALANASFTLPSPPGTGSVAGAGTYAVALCTPDFVRAMVHGYFEMSGDPSGRPASQVAISGAAAGSAGSYVLPAGRWVLPEDWPLLATFAGFNGSQPLDVTPSSVFAWDLNSGWAFNPTGESPVICGLAAGFLSSASDGLLLGGSAGAHGATSGTIPTGFLSAGGAEDLGPCFGQDAAQIKAAANGFYSTAPGSLNGADTLLYGAALIARYAGAQDQCLAGYTAGFGPFDATRACTDPFPLTYSPAGASIVGLVAGSCGVGVAAPCLAPTHPDSTYLPNGSLNEWDAPMPPAQVSFAITGGPGYLGEVNKTGLYQIKFDTGAGAPCPTGYTLYAGTNTCQLELDPNPFYAEAIPASPLIPPVTNNGGYLFNSWNFSFGTTTIVRSTPAFAGVAAGGFVAGQSTTVNFLEAAAGPYGTACPTLSATAAAAPAGGATGPTCTFAGGVNITATGAGTATPSSIVVGNGQGFYPGETVEIYSNVTGTDVVAPGAAIISAVLPSPRTVNGISYPNAVELQLTDTTGAPFALPAFGPTDVTVIAGDFGLPVTGAAAFQVGQLVDIGAPVGTHSFTTTVTRIDTTNNIVYVAGAESVARAFGDCALSRTPVGSGATGAGPFPGGVAYGNCEPSALIAPGTVVDSGPVGSAQVAPTCPAGYTFVAATDLTGASCTAPAGSPAALPTCPAGSRPFPDVGAPTTCFTEEPTSLYPFWQWLPNAPAATDTPSTATVYSDNHGEAVVTLNTSFQAQVAPVNGVCPSPYTPVAYGTQTTPATCIAQLGALGTANIGNGTLANVKAALAAFSATNPGCIQTYPSGTSAALTGVTVGASGPASGQICVNNLGAVEFGASAYLGATTVQAVADYPYTRGEHPQVGSAPLTKVFTSGFAKTLSVSAGTPGPAGTTSYTVTITATDVCGNPITGEPVQVYALSGSAGAVVLAPLSVGGILSANSNSASVLVNQAGSANAGTATLSLEVLNSALGTGGLVIKAVFPFEQIERFYTVVAPTTPTQSATVVYPPGWQQVGGPAGSNFSTAEALFSYDPAAGQYANATSAAGNVSSAAPGCTGYWAYFAAAMAVSLPATSKSGDTAACTLAAGYNLVGNPFATPAKLPSGVTAYHWNGTSYDTVGTIGQGQSVWVFNDGTLNSLTLTAT